MTNEDLCFECRFARRQGHGCSVLPGTHSGVDPSSQDDGSSKRQLVRVSCALVVVVCLYVVLRADV